MEKKVLLNPKFLRPEGKGSSFVALGIMATGALLLSGCLSGPKEEPEIPEIQTPQVTACADLTPSQKTKGDSLVNLANAKMSADMEYMFSGKVEEWNDIQGRSSQSALNYYDQALAAAPGHCGAILGRAVASTMMTTQDPRLDAFITKAEKAANGQVNNEGLKVSSGMGLLKLSPDQAAPELLKLSSNMEKIEYPTVTEFQSLVETTLMPKVDSAINSLEQVLNYTDFTFEFTTKERGRIQIDHGEIGPLLAGLKVIKAWLTVAAGYQWELAVNGKYAWAESLQNIDDSDFDQLRPGQIAALDYVTGLFKTSSPFSKVKPAWKNQVKAIPTLLLSAIDNAQKGLNYAIGEANNVKGQEYDLYTVGVGPDFDVDPSDLKDAVDILERAKKYLRGEVNITYNRGIRSLKINFPKVFEIDGIQNHLPYFTIRPYKEWNDTIEADTSWVPAGYYPQDNLFKEKLGYSNQDYELNFRPKLDVNSKIVGYDIVTWSFAKVQYLNPSQQIVLASYSQIPNKPCSFTYEKFYNRIPDPMAITPGNDTGLFLTSRFKSIPTSSRGAFTINACRETINGAEYVDYIDAKTKGPFYFTTPSGELTVEIADLEKYDDDLPALRDKIFFRDPKFGGIFPELTQATIWEVVNSMKNIDTKSRRVCTEKLTPGGYYEYVCQNRKASELSDLDLLLSTIEIMDGPL